MYGQMLSRRTSMAIWCPDSRMGHARTHNLVGIVPFLNVHRVSTASYENRASIDRLV